MSYLTTKLWQIREDLIVYADELNGVRIDLLQGATAIDEVLKVLEEDVSQQKDT